jgi:ADP-heptose:LPS heptosyltransferase
MNHSAFYYFCKDIRVLLYLLMDRLALVGCSFATKSNTVLLIRLDKIGDFILWLDSASRLRQHFAGKQLVLIADHTFVDLAERCGCFDQVVPIDEKRLVRNPIYRWRALRLVRKLGAQVAIQPVSSRVILAGDSILRASAAREKIGNTGDLSNIKPWQRRLSDRWYTKIVPAQTAPMMELECNSEFLRWMGLSEVVPRVANMPVLTTLPVALQLQKPYFILFPGASWVGKMWPVASFAACLDALQRQYGWRAVLCGTAGERALCQAVIDVSASKQASNLAGDTSLSEFVELVRGANLLIGNDTSAMHIAAAVGTPAVCLLGGGHFGRFMPYPDSVEGTKPIAVFHKMPCYGCNWVCTQPHAAKGCVPCIERITVDEVLQAAEMALRLQKDG